MNIVGHMSDHTLAETSYSYFLSLEALLRMAHALPYRFLPRKCGTVARLTSSSGDRCSLYCTRNEGGMSIKNPMVNDVIDVDQCGRCTNSNCRLLSLLLGASRVTGYLRC